MAGSRRSVPNVFSEPFKRTTSVPRPRSGDKESFSPAIWAGVKKLPDTAHSDLILNFTVPEGNAEGLPPGQFVAFLEWKEEWGKYTGRVKKDNRPPQKGGSEWKKQQQQQQDPPPPNGDDIPF